MLPSNSAAARPAYLLDQLGLDYRFEVVAAELLADALPAGAVALQQLIFNPLGPTTRPYATDYSAPQFLAAENSLHPYWRLDIPREGLYDQLPPFLFHPIEPGAPAADLLEQVQQAHAVEQETRQFFLPFDTELQYLRVLRSWQQRQNDHLEHAPALLAQFAEGWPILRRLERSQASLFVQLLPYVHQLRGNLSWLAQLLTVFFDVPVRFATEQPIAYEAIEVPIQRLGQCRLGIDAIADSSLDEGYDAIHLHLGPVPVERTAEFLPASPRRTLLTELLAYFVPVAADVVTFVHIAPAATSDVPGPTYLGYNSYLTAGTAAVNHRTAAS